MAIADGRSRADRRGRLEVLHTPGHSPDHLAFWHADSRTLFVGDLLVQGSTRRSFPPPRRQPRATTCVRCERMLAARGRARVAGARSGDRRSGGADSRTTSSIARSAKCRCWRRSRPGSSTVEPSPRDLSARSPTRWCRWRARACWRICRSSKSEGRGASATASSGRSRP